jgi:hypothetical protein
MPVRCIFAYLWRQAQLPNDSVGNSIRIMEVVGPKPDYPPTRFAQGSSPDAVARDVALKLGKPVARVRRRLVTVFRTTMPEAAIHKNNDALLVKREVRLAR